MQRHDLAKDRLALVPALAILRHNTRPDLDLLDKAQDTLEDRASRDTTLELVNLGTGLVDIEGADNDEAGFRGEVTDGDGHVFHNILIDGVNVVLELGRDGDNRRVFGNSACRNYATLISI